METENYFTIRIADINIRIAHRFPLVRLLCREYITDDAPADLTVSVTEEEILAARSDYEDIQSDWELENLLVLLKILRAAHRFQAAPLHAAVIEYEGRGYAFAAPSGTGKSTHIRLWREAFGDGVHVINGDKPLLKALPEEDGSYRIRAYGTPWCGKERQHKNSSVPLAGLCFLERGSGNAIRPCSEEEAVAAFLESIPLPVSAEEADFYLWFADKLLSCLPTYRLTCNQDIDAALTAYCGMNPAKDTAKEN